MGCILSSGMLKRFNAFFIAMSIFLCPFATADQGLPLFWWKEGNFINFGDHLSYILVERIVGCPLRCYNKRSIVQDKKLLASGSIFYFAYEGDVVWGSGINGKRPNKDEYLFNSLDIRSVRGPLTRAFLQDNFGILAPEVYGDPALLFPYLFPEFKKSETPKNAYSVIVHYLDSGHFVDSDDSHLVSGIAPWDTVIKEILNSEFVISSSLHGVVIAEAYGIPARLLRLSDHEPLLKFHDYYQGTGRQQFQFATSIQEALSMGGEPKIDCDVEKIYRAFPFEFWPDSNFPNVDFSIKAHL